MKLVILVILVPSLFFAEAAPTAFDPLTLLTQIGIGSVIAAPFYLLWRDERKQRLIADERLISFLEKQGPILVEAVATLEKVQGGMEQAVERVQVAPDRTEWDRALRRVELVGDELRDELRRVRGRPHDEA